MLAHRPARGGRERGLLHPRHEGPSAYAQFSVRWNNGVGESAPVSGKDIRLPKGYVVRRVEGVVVLPDGRPVDGASVALHAQARPPEDATPYDWETTDGRGRFALEGFVGAEYWVSASVYAHRLKPGKDFSEEGDRRLSARPFKVKVARSNAPLRLVIILPEGAAAPDKRQENRR